MSHSARASVKVCAGSATEKPPPSVRLAGRAPGRHWGTPGTCRSHAPERPAERPNLVPSQENALPLIDRMGADLPRAAVSLELDDIQSTVLHQRPEPYFGTHVMLHVEDSRSGRELLRRLTPHVDSAADWWQADDTWMAVAVTYPGLVALGVPQDSLQSFPDAFRVGMAARATQLRDDGANDPQRWDKPFGTGEIHIAISIFSDSQERWRRALETARNQYDGLSGVRVLVAQDFGAQPGDRNPLGYKDSIGQPAIEGCGVDSLPGQGRPIKAGEFILGYPGRGRCAAADAAARCAGTQRHVRRTAQVPVAGRDVQSLLAGTGSR